MKKKNKFLKKKNFKNNLIYFRDTIFFFFFNKSLKSLLNFSIFFFKKPFIYFLKGTYIFNIIDGEVIILNKKRKNFKNIIFLFLFQLYRVFFFLLLNNKFT